MPIRSTSEIDKDPYKLVDIEQILLNPVPNGHFEYHYIYPSPDISGKYLPHPNTGGKDSAKEYIQVIAITFIDVAKTSTFPSKIQKLEKHAIRLTESITKVIIEVKPEYG